MLIHHLRTGAFAPDKRRKRGADGGSKPTTLSLFKAGDGGSRSGGYATDFPHSPPPCSDRLGLYRTANKIAMMEAKLWQIEQSSTSSPPAHGPLYHPSLPDASHLARHGRATCTFVQT